MPPAQQLPSAVIGIATYRRAADLDRALRSLLDEIVAVERPVHILVVDNDPQGSAAAPVAAFADRGVRYLHQPEPGIAAARNMALDAAGDGELLIYVDDDEHPEPGWLERMLDMHARTNAAAVAGAVISEYETELDPWLAAGRFFDRRRLPTGTAIEVAATNNLLLDMAQVRPLGLRFDAAFGLTGGSDTLFTRQLTRAGASMVWCDEAVVVDRVPAARISREWVLKRAFRTGNSDSRVAVATAGSAGERMRARATATVKGLLRIAGGWLRVLVGLVTGSLRHQARGRRTASRGAGMIAGAYGSFYTEYARS